MSQVQAKEVPELASAEQAIVSFFFLHFLIDLSNYNLSFSLTHWPGMLWTIQANNRLTVQRFWMHPTTFNIMSWNISEFLVLLPVFDLGRDRIFSEQR